MNQHPDPKLCARATGDFASYLYGELEGEAREFVENHLATCTACHTALAEEREIMARLDDWKLPTQAKPENAALIAAQVRSLDHGIGSSDPAPTERATTDARNPESSQRAQTSRRRSQWVRLSARLTAAAAALLVSCSLLGTEVSSNNGQFHLSFSMPWMRPTVPTDTATSPVFVPEQEVRAIAADEFSTQAISFEEQLQKLQSRWTRETASERQRFAIAVDRSQEESRRAILALENVMTQLSRRQEQLDQRTRDALVELTEAVLVLSD